MAVQLAAGDIIIVSSGRCADRANPLCTSLAGVRPTTIDRISTLQRDVGAPIVITGGTEAGHSRRGTLTHGNGYKIDLRTTPELNNYIARNF